MRKSAMVIAAGLACSVLATPGSAGAATVSEPIADGFAGPLQIAVGATGQVYVAQDFAGVLSGVGKNGGVSDLVVAPGTEIAGVAAAGDGTVFYTTSIGGSEESPPTATLLRRVLPHGHVSTGADRRRGRTQRHALRQPAARRSGRPELRGTRRGVLGQPAYRRHAQDRGRV